MIQSNPGRLGAMGSLLPSGGHLPSGCTQDVLSSGMRKEEFLRPPGGDWKVSSLSCAGAHEHERKKAVVG